MESSDYTLNYMIGTTITAIQYKMSLLPVLSQLSRSNTMSHKTLHFIMLNIAIVLCTSGLLVDIGFMMSLNSVGVDFVIGLGLMVLLIISALKLAEKAVDLP